MDISVISTTFLLQLTLILTIIWITINALAYRKMPPGPFGLPFVGYYPFLGKYAYEKYRKLRKKYGDIFSVKVGTKNHIIIGDCDLAKEIINNPLTFARPQLGREMFPGKGGFSFASGKEWMKQRKFSVSALKTLGLGTGKWEALIQDAVEQLIAKFYESSGKPANHFRSLQCSIAGNIFSLLTGKKQPKDENDADFKVLMKFIDEFLISLNSTNISANMPLIFLKIAKIYPIGLLRSTLESINEFENLIKKEINRKIVSPDQNKEPDFIDHYLQEMKKQEISGNDKDLTTAKLSGDIMTLFTGGFDTNLASISWLLLTMASNQRVQEKVHQEIDDVIGRDRRIFWGDHTILPYTMATIYEIERWASIVPLTPPRWNSVPIAVRDYVIPKNCCIIVNLWDIMRNEKYFDHPDVFEPERFLDSNKEIQKSANFIPFSFGKRNCPGEHVALMTIFIYFTSIMQKFRITAPDNEPVKLEDKGYAAVRHPVYQELCFITR